VSGTDLVGWAATALFAASYFCREPRTLRLTQAAAALLWLAYGVVLQAAPVIVANVIVAGLALWSAWSDSPRAAREEPRERPVPAVGPSSPRRTGRVPGARRHPRLT
jgi:hypothetical protein